MKLIWILSPKNRTFFKQILSGISKLPSVRPEELFAENDSFFKRNLCFLYEFWSCSDFFCPLAKMLSRWAKTAMHVFRGINCRNFTLKNCFFFNCLDFEQKNLDFLWKNNGTFFKTVAYVSLRKKFRKNIFG